MICRMATEIELKARVSDSEALRRLLNEKAEYLGAFVKDDTYWQLPGGQRLRVRRDRRNKPDGSEECAIYVTRKKKALKDGIEINYEREFEVKFPPEKRPGEGLGEGPSTDQFTEILAEIGLKPGLSKQKRGWAYNYLGITAELVEVSGNGLNLGWFMELEIIVPDGAACREKATTKERERLMDFLSELGIGAEAIEGRYYNELLGCQ